MAFFWVTPERESSNYIGGRQKEDEDHEDHDDITKIDSWGSCQPNYFLRKPHPTIATIFTFGLPSNPVLFHGLKPGIHGLLLHRGRWGHHGTVAAAPVVVHLGVGGPGRCDGSGHGNLGLGII